jgi:hypothetical protein
MSQSTKSVLIVGGYGTFGGRLAQLLAGDARLTLLIAGRSQTKAAQFCGHLRATARLVPLTFDRDGNLDAQLAQIRPDIVVDATGPFQSYGDDPYRLVNACVAQGISYLDLADGSDFVKGIGRFDSEAKAKNIFVLSGVSSFPVLTAAVLRELSKGMSRVDTLTAGIAPSPYAGVGLNVIRAIAGYAGKPVRLIRDGRQSTSYALTEAKRYTIAPPGRLPLRNIRFSLVDVPDLQLIPDMAPAIKTLWVGAGPVPEILHLALSTLAWLVRLKLIPSLSPFSRLFFEVINILRWGEHRGGMFVSVDGVDDLGRRIERSWHLLAEADDGPLIPSMAVEAIIHHTLSGRGPSAGARAAIDALTLADYDALFAQRTIFTGRREATPSDKALPLYHQILGDAWESLPPQLKAMHSVQCHMTAMGTATVERGNGFLSRVAGALIGFPKAMKNCPVEVSFDVSGDNEVWRRTFGAESFSSVQTAGRGRSKWLISEQFGLLSFGLALVLDGGKMRLVVRRWSFLGIPLPLALAPRNDAYESVENGLFHFHVEIGYRLTGLIVRYRGWLEPSV